MPEIKDISGQKFGRLTAIEQIGKDDQSHYIWLCTCSCGNEIRVTKNHLLSGDTRSCGCLQKEQARDRLLEHGGWLNGEPSRLYRIWHGIKQRCYNPNREAYRLYGEKGIKVCEKWKESFVAFRDWAKSNEYSDDLTIDRIDGNGDYCPENCRWATYKQQARNRTNGSNCVTYQGETKTIAGWAEEFNLPYKTLYQRLERYDWPIERAFNEPVGAYYKGGKE